MLIRDPRVSVALLLVLVIILSFQVRVLDGQSAMGFLVTLLAWLVGYVTDPNKKGGPDETPR